jgi:hypothetical protein
VNVFHSGACCRSQCDEIREDEESGEGLHRRRFRTTVQDMENGFEIENGSEVLEEDQILECRIILGANLALIIQTAIEGRIHSRPLTSLASDLTTPSPPPQDNNSTEVLTFLQLEGLDNSKDSMS